MNVRDPLTSRVRLERDEVHLWWRRVKEEDPSESSRAWLSDEERRRSERFRREQDARAFLARRCFLRSVLASYLGCSPQELLFKEGPFGKPSLTGLGAELSFRRTEREEVGATRKLAALLSMEQDLLSVTLTDPLPDPAGRP